MKWHWLYLRLAIRAATAVMRGKFRLEAETKSTVVDGWVQQRVVARKIIVDYGKC